MSIASPTTVHAELETEHADVIRSTLPLVGANIDTITRTFYSGLFEAHPELLRNLFNRGNQAQGAQQRALAASIATFASHLVDPDLPHPADMLSRIGHKHASLGITAEQYDIVHEHLFAAIVEVLGAETVTAEVAAAWDRVYWMMADVLIDLERRLSAAAGVTSGQVFHRATVTRRVDDPSGTVVLSVVADWRLTDPRQPARYVSVGAIMPDGARQIRQYSLVTVVDDNELTFAVKPVAASGGCPAGEVSTWVAAHVRPGDILDVSLPFGDLPTSDIGTGPVVLISAGIGITPMNGILEHLHRWASDCAVTVLHADSSPATHPLRERQQQLVDALPNAVLELWYDQPGEVVTAHRGRMDVSDAAIPADAAIYVCGSSGFVQAVRAQLTERAVDPSRVHCELFAPDEWVLG
ncbi:globin domain-containing protein [Rhodococcoides yunnanense]|uniref:globin domain-containing protein n=1 Tax=Rhodococcoides yunnanense TaxID=278209 RepID=UPI0009325751|nr:globin domain-containing protein [Rhodococcus yunnanensis]